MRSVLIQAWSIYRFNDQYFLPYTHWIYLKEIVKYFDRVCLLSPTRVLLNAPVNGEISIDEFKQVQVFELPFADGYIAALKLFPSYFKAYRSLGSFDTLYVRYPTPFGWLQKLLHGDRRRIVHFVGDPIDTIKNNPRMGKVKQWVFTLFFFPEHWMYMWACKGAKIYTNGFHLAKRLESYNIRATALVSSTLTESDFYYEEGKLADIGEPRIIYVGYLRKAKGVETVIRAFALVQSKFPSARLTIVGSGESEKELRSLVSQMGLKNLSFAGHIDDRKKLNLLLREHDVFCFASLSEGSPRVILEAMANGLNVVSTPVGSLPFIFQEGKEVLFADFNDVQGFYSKMCEIIEDSGKAEYLRRNAYLLVSEFTVERFLKSIFYEN